ncbi:hypothetical protein M6B38_249200 [Iris pallida]|uniref:Photosystem II protein I n=1 Tax=Iris pallida TaxID=29817 RepID=A0AAX6DFC4_IRIPA|nr:hypothetical protein M6B38_249200 [Iris pallida]
MKNKNLKRKGSSIFVLYHIYIYFLPISKKGDIYISRYLDE